MAKVVDNRTSVRDCMKLLLHPTAVVLQNTTKRDRATPLVHWYSGTVVSAQWSEGSRRLVTTDLDLSGSCFYVEIVKGGAVHAQ